jgi:hypothetical protein
MENRDNNYIGEPLNDPEAGRIDRVREKTRETVDRAKEKLAAGAAGATEMGRTAVSGVRDRATRAAEFVRDAETDVELKGAVTHRTESSLDRAGDAITRAAPTIGRGTEMAAEKLGHALHAISHPTGVLLGTIAGTLGGWWRKAADQQIDLPQSEDQACLEHFSTIAAPPPGMTYEQARPAYALGYVASRNPSFRGRDFDEVDRELRDGFARDQSSDYDSVREFTRYGYERGVGE